MEIANAEKKSFEGTWRAIEDSLNNQIILTANDAGLKHHKRMLKINVPASDAIETRRFRLLTRHQEQAPYTNKVLKQLLAGLLGTGHYEFTRNTSGKWRKVKFELTVKGQFKAVELMLQRITPQNMVLTVELRYNQHSTLARFTHAQLDHKA